MCDEDFGPLGGYSNLACGFGGSLRSFCAKVKERYAAESLTIQNAPSLKKLHSQCAVSACDNLYIIRTF
jgi:hypothetical protein